MTWYAYRITETQFGIFDTFFDDEARRAHLSREVAQALGKISEDLLERPPGIDEIDILASKP